jgi:hypothetical protein
MSLARLLGREALGFGLALLLASLCGSGLLLGGGRQTAMPNVPAIPMFEFGDLLNLYVRFYAIGIDGSVLSRETTIDSRINVHLENRSALPEPHAYRDIETGADVVDNGSAIQIRHRQSPVEYEAPTVAVHGFRGSSGSFDMSITFLPKSADAYRAAIADHYSFAVTGFLTAEGIWRVSTSSGNLSLDNLIELQLLARQFKQMERDAVAERANVPHQAPVIHRKYSTPEEAQAVLNVALAHEFKEPNRGGLWTAWREGSVVCTNNWADLGYYETFYTGGAAFVERARHRSRGSR